MLSKQEKHGAARSDVWASVHRDGAELGLATRTGCIVTCCFRRSHQPEELMAVMELSTEPLGKVFISCSRW